MTAVVRNSSGDTCQVVVVASAAAAAAGDDAAVVAVVVVVVVAWRTWARIVWVTGTDEGVAVVAVDAAAVDDGKRTSV